MEVDKELSQPYVQVSYFLNRSFSTTLFVYSDVITGSQIKSHKVKFKIVYMWLITMVYDFLWIQKEKSHYIIKELVLFWFSVVFINVGFIRSKNLHDLHEEINQSDKNITLKSR